MDPYSDPHISHYSSCHVLFHFLLPSEPKASRRNILLPDSTATNNDQVIVNPKPNNDQAIVRPLGCVL